MRGAKRSPQLPEEAAGLLLLQSVREKLDNSVRNATEVALRWRHYGGDGVDVVVRVFFHFLLDT